MDFITWAIQRADELLKTLNGDRHSGEENIAGPAMGQLAPKSPYHALTPLCP